MVECLHDMDVIKIERSRLVMKGIKKINRIILFIFVMIAAFCLCHDDAYDSIVPWALEFIRLTKQGRMFEFYTFTHGIGVYNLMIILIVALWMLPFHLFMKVVGISYNIAFYVMWYKILLIGALFLSCDMFRKCLIKIGFNKEKSDLGVLMFAVSPMVLLGNIGMGQVDIIATYFVIFSIYCVLDEKDTIAFALLSIAVSMKYFAIILIIPYILLKEKNIYKIIKNVFICTIIPIIVEFVSGLDPYYSKTKNDMINRLIEVNFNFVSLFLLTVFALFIISYYIKIDNNNRWCEVALPALTYIMFLLFVMFHPQWVVCFLPLFIIMTLSLKNEEFALLLFVGTSIGYVLYIICVWSTSVTNYMINKSLICFLTGISYNGPYLQELIHVWNGETGKSMMMACILMIIAIFVYEKTRNDKSEEVVSYSGIEKIKQEILFIPSGVFLLSTLILFFIYRE